MVLTEFGYLLLALSVLAGLLFCWLTASCFSLRAGHRKRRGAPKFGTRSSHPTIRPKRELHPANLRERVIVADVQFDGLRAALLRDGK